MKNSEDLFQLIKSLTKAEKRYFKLFASRNMIKDNNNYVKLFEQIEKQKQYDEKQIRKSFANERFIKNLSVTKFFLYKLLLKSLRAYHTDLSIDSQLKELLREVEILYEKALYAQCIKLLAKAKKIGYKYEKHLSILEILWWEKQIYKSKLINIKGLDKKLDEILAEEKQMLEQYKNVNEFFWLDAKMVSLAEKEGLVRTKPYLEKLLASQQISLKERIDLNWM